MSQQRGSGRTVLSSEAYGRLDEGIRERERRLHAVESQYRAQMEGIRASIARGRESLRTEWLRQQRHNQRMLDERYASERKAIQNELVAMKLDLQQCIRAQKEHIDNQVEQLHRELADREDAERRFAFGELQNAGNDLRGLMRMRKLARFVTNTDQLQALHGMAERSFTDGRYQAAAATAINLRFHLTDARAGAERHQSQWEDRLAVARGLLDTIDVLLDRARCWIPSAMPDAIPQDLTYYAQEDVQEALFALEPFRVLLAEPCEATVESIEQAIPALQNGLDRVSKAVEKATNSFEALGARMGCQLALCTAMAQRRWRTLKRTFQGDDQRQALLLLWQHEHLGNRLAVSIEPCYCPERNDFDHKLTFVVRLCTAQPQEAELAYAKEMETLIQQCVGGVAGLSVPGVAHRYIRSDRAVQTVLLLEKKECVGV